MYVVVLVWFSSNAFLKLQVCVAVEIQFFSVGTFFKFHTTVNILRDTFSYFILCQSSMFIVFHVLLLWNSFLLAGFGEVKALKVDF